MTTLQKALVRVDLAHREFVANVSHDFRTPLAAIRGYAETLLRGEVRDGRLRRRFTWRILRNTERLENLVDDLLYLSALESGRVPAKPEVIRFGALARAYFREIAPLAKKKQIEFRLSVGPRVRVKTDRAQLNKILQNLVSNALKYNRQGGWVRVGCVVEGGKAVISVKDSGVGIAKDELPRIFDRFYRVDKSRPGADGGSGLGLNIARRLIEGAGNRIWVNSKEGKGTTFYFTVDLA